VPDEARYYRDYVVGTGRLHHVWELADRAFALAGFELAWSLDGADPLEWSAAFADTGEPAVVVDPAFLRPADPQAISADPGRIVEELGWQPHLGLDVFLEDMLAATSAAAASRPLPG
jgi:GDP-D-mannose dehydratase